ncbi:hypothetical protein Pint_14456 [Pistacia integerrima]|uniref:Uncharacterized protein n=2 Tax=Pistacia integerrima TaxID=434235 RepID=A0ACC0Y3I9_9ROSI|nr:hypothetical protein Pint_14456 [Pistacia integerrima]
MIAAMANYLGYDIYDLELTEVHNNSELRKLLMKTSSKSIIVIEDIDCSVNLTNRKSNKSHGGSGSRNYYEPAMRYGSGGGGGNNNNSITLSGLLNFTDGIWSCCGSERIFVFTTNHIEKFDHALLRSGRMDMHIYMSYCTYPALLILLKNYLDYEESDLESGMLMDLQEVIEKAEMTPADISEALIKNKRNKEKAVKELVETLKVRAEKRLKNGGLREKKSNSDFVEEEQEKRALESPNKDEGTDFDEDHNTCKKERDEEDERSHLQHSEFSTQL